MGPSQNDIYHPWPTTKEILDCQGVFGLARVKCENQNKNLFPLYLLPVVYPEVFHFHLYSFNSHLKSNFHTFSNLAVLITPMVE